MVKWTANKAAKPVLAALGQDQLAPPIRVIDLMTEDPLPPTKVIGCLWDAELDLLKIQISLDRPVKYTRRSLLSQVSQQFDPLGFSAPLLSRFIDIHGPVSNIHSDNGATFIAAANVLPAMLESKEWQSFFRKKDLALEFIPPYSLAQSGALKSMAKVFKRTLTNITDLLRRTPNFIGLQTYISNTTRLVNDRPMTPLSEDPRDYSAISPSSLLTPAFHPSTSVGKPHDRDELRRDYRFNVALAENFWHRWMKFYLPLLQRRKKWFKAVTNLQVGQMVLVGEPTKLRNAGNICWVELVRFCLKFVEGEVLCVPQ